MDGGRVLVTGSGGMIGRAVVRDLLDHGYRVTPVDRRPMQDEETRLVDCEDYGEVAAVMQGHAAVRR